MKNKRNLNFLNSEQFFNSKDKIVDVKEGFSCARER